MDAEYRIVVALHKSKATELGTRSPKSIYTYYNLQHYGVVAITS